MMISSLHLIVTIKTMEYRIPIQCISCMEQIARMPSVEDDVHAFFFPLRSSRARQTL